MAGYSFAGCAATDSALLSVCIAAVSVFPPAGLGCCFRRIVDRLLGAHDLRPGAGNWRRFLRERGQSRQLDRPALSAGQKVGWHVGP